MDNSVRELAEVDAVTAFKFPALQHFHRRHK